MNSLAMASAATLPGRAGLGTIALVAVALAVAPPAVLAEGALLPGVERLTLGRGAATFGNEAVAQLTTNPPSPDLSSGGDPADSKYDLMSGSHRLLETNLDALRSIDESWKKFFKDPVGELVPMVKAGASSSISPILHPLQTEQQIRDYYKEKGAVDGTAQLVYTVTNVGSLAAIVAGAAAVGAMAVGIPAAAGLASAALAGLSVMSVVGLVANVGQLVYDEAQAAAPQKGVKLPSWLSGSRTRYLFHPTTHQQQTDLLKFDILNVGGSVLMMGFARLGEHVEPHVTPPARVSSETLASAGTRHTGPTMEAGWRAPVKAEAGPPPEDAVSRHPKTRGHALTYFGLGATEAGVAAGSTPLAGK